MKVSISSSGVAHAVTDSGHLLCMPTLMAGAITGADFPTCLNCLKKLKRMNDQDELRKQIHELPKMVRCGDGHIRLRRVIDDGRIMDKLTPFVTQAAADQWLDMAKRAKVDLANVVNIP